MRGPDFLLSRTPEELGQDVQDIAKALNKWANLLRMFPPFVRAVSQMFTILRKVCQSPEFQKAIMEKVAEDPAQKHLTIGGKDYEVTDWTVEFDNEEE